MFRLKKNIDTLTCHAIYLTVQVYEIIYLKKKKIIIIFEKEVITLYEFRCHLVEYELCALCTVQLYFYTLLNIHNYP